MLFKFKGIIKPLLFIQLFRSNVFVWKCSEFKAKNCIAIVKTSMSNKKIFVLNPNRISFKMTVFQTFQLFCTKLSGQVYCPNRDLQKKFVTKYKVSSKTVKLFVFNEVYVCRFQKERFTPFTSFTPFTLFTVARFFRSFFLCYILHLLSFSFRFHFPYSFAILFIVFRRFFLCIVFVMEFVPVKGLEFVWTQFNSPNKSREQRIYCQIPTQIKKKTKRNVLT